MVWTINRLRLHLAKETGIELSEPRFRALLKVEGYRYHRPKYYLGHLQNKEAKAKADEMLGELKKGPRNDFELIFMNETTLSLDPLLRA